MFQDLSTRHDSTQAIATFTIFKFFFLGIRTRTRWCVVKDDQSPVDTSTCGGPPEETEPCNNQPCAAKLVFSHSHGIYHVTNFNTLHVRLLIIFVFRSWVMKWAQCSKTCGKGKQVHIKTCLQQVNESLVRESDTCKDPKPNPPSVLVRFCNEYPCPLQWIVGNWSKVNFWLLFSFKSLETPIRSSTKNGC